MNKKGPCDNDKAFMAKAVAKSMEHWGMTNPNPSVGTVITKNGEMIACEATATGGRPHSEIIALEKAGNSAVGSDLYVTLEPCSHTGRTPPCAEAVIESRVKRVFVGCRDPNPEVNGRGIRAMRKAGIKVITDFLKAQCAEPNEWFFKQFISDLPYVIVKSAISLDGKTATRTGNSKWLSSPETLRFAHVLRRQADAVMVGKNTVLKDNPRLNVRISGPKKDPHRIVLDREGNLPLHLNIFVRNNSEHVYYFSSGHHSERFRNLPHVKTFRVDQKKGGLDMAAVLRILRGNGVFSVLCEGGGELNASLFEGGFVDKVIMVITPKLVGGRDAKTPFEGIGVEKVERALALEDVSWTAMGSDLIYTGHLKRYH